MRIFTWHVHGNYLYYLSQTSAEFFLPLKEGYPHPYGGRGDTFAFGPNVHEIPAQEVRNHSFDCILFQSPRNYLVDQYEVLSGEQRALPRVYLEHDPPRETPTDTVHPVDDPDVTVVHVTAFNALMWDNRGLPTTIIEHGVMIPPSVRYTGEIPRGLVIINNLASRGRRLGRDVFERVREQVPLDLVGMGSEELGGMGEIPPMELPAFAARYRFTFSPIRYTSLGLAICEAMTIGLPVVGLATCELANVVENGVTGYIDTDPERLIPHMLRLIESPDEGRRLGANARRIALERFGIDRFAGDWRRRFECAIEASALAAATHRGGS